MTTALFSLGLSHWRSASDWCALQEALYKCIDTIEYNTIKSSTLSNDLFQSSKSKNGIGGAPTNYRWRRRGDQQKSAAAAPTNSRRWCDQRTDLLRAQLNSTSVHTVLVITLCPLLGLNCQ